MSSFAASVSMPHSGHPGEDHPSPEKKPLIPSWVKEVATTSGKIAGTGAAMGAVCDVIAQPFYRVQTQAMIQGANPTGVQYKGVFDGLRTIYRQDGPKGLFRGLPAVLSAGPFGTGLFFMGLFGTQNAYKGSSVETWASEKIGQDRALFASNFVSGYMGQLAASLFFVPSSVVSECQQAKGFNQEFEKLTLSQAVRRIYAMGGIAGFYKGLWPQVLSFGTCHALSVPVYMHLKKELEALGYAGPAASIFSGVAGYGFGSYLTQPLAVAKNRLQVAKINPDLFPERNTVSAVLGIARREGVKSLMSGANARAAFIMTRLGLGIPLAGIAQKKLEEVFGSPSM